MSLSLKKGNEIILIPGNFLGYVSFRNEVVSPPPSDESLIFSIT
jgi:hypothetical protein